MAVTLVATGAQENLNGSGGTINLAAPASIAAGDLRLHLCVTIGVSGVPGAGAGMTDVGGAGQSTGTTSITGIRVQRKIAGGSETTISHTAPGSTTGGVAIRATGVDQTTPINVAATTTAAGTVSSQLLPTVTTTVNNCLICYWVFGGSQSPSITGPSLILTSFTAAGSLVRLYAETLVTAGTSTARTVTFGASTECLYAVFAIAPPGPAVINPVSGFSVTTSAVANIGGTVTVNPVGGFSVTTSAVANVGGIGTPNAPTGVTARAGPESALFEWVAPSSTGGSPITGYKVERNTAAAGWTPATANTGSTRPWFLDLYRTDGTTLQYRVSAINANGTGATSAPSAVVTPAFKPMPTVVSANGRYIQDQVGNMWPILGDASPMWPQSVTNAVVLDDLDKLAARNFTMSRMKPIEWASVDSGATFPIYTDVTTGLNPFTTSPYVGALVNGFWDRMEYIIAHSMVRGLTVLVQPFWCGWVGTYPQTIITSISVANIQAQGNAVGARLARYPNIVWAFGGDGVNPPDVAMADRLEAFKDGVLAAFATAEEAHFVMIYPAEGSTSSGYAASRWYSGADALPAAWRLNSSYDYSRTADLLVSSWTANVGPTWLAEGLYQDDRQSDPIGVASLADLRKQSWWSLIAGNGTMFGDNPRFWLKTPALEGFFSQVGSATLAQTWDDPTGDYDRGTLDFQVLIGRALSWTSWLGETLLDTTGTFLVSGATSGATLALARFSTKHAVVYMPTSRAINLDLTELAAASSTVVITRIDPVSGVSTVVNAAAPTTNASFAIAAPGNNSAGDSDWVFLVDRGVHLHVGGVDVTALKVGTATATKAYIGTVQVWP